MCLCGCHSGCPSVCLYWGVTVLLCWVSVCLCMCTVVSQPEQHTAQAATDVVVTMCVCGCHNVCVWLSQCVCVVVSVCVCVCWAFVRVRTLCRDVYCVHMCAHALHLSVLVFVFQNPKPQSNVATEICTGVRGAGREKYSFK